MAKNTQKTKISHADSELVLKNMATYSRSGQNTKNILNALIDTETSPKIKSLLIEIKVLHVQRQVSFSKVLLSYGLIEENEFRIVDETDNFSVAVDMILSIRNSNGKIKQSFMSITLAPIIIIPIVLFLAAYMSPIIVGFLFGIAESLKTGASKNINVMGYMHHSEYMIIAGIAILAIYIGFVSFYLYLENTNIKKLYKYFPIKTYEDLPIILKIYQIYGERGMSNTTIAQNLSTLKAPKGVGSMFKIPSRQFKSFAEIFKKYGITYDVISIFEASERNDELLTKNEQIKSIKTNKATSPLEWLIEYCEEVIKNKLDYYENKKFGMGLKKLGTYLWASILFFFVGTMYLTLMMSLSDIRKIADSLAG